MAAMSRKQTLGRASGRSRAEHDLKSGHGNLVNVGDILPSGQGTVLNKKVPGPFVGHYVNNL